MMMTFMATIFKICMMALVLTGGLTVLIRCGKFLFKNVKKEMKSKRKK